MVQEGKYEGEGKVARVVYVVFAFEPYILHECGQCELAAWQPLRDACLLLSGSVCACVSFNIIAYLRAAYVCVCVCTGNSCWFRSGLGCSCSWFGLFFFEP